MRILKHESPLVFDAKYKEKLNNEKFEIHFRDLKMHLRKGILDPKRASDSFFGRPDHPVRKHAHIADDTYNWDATLDSLTNILFQ